MLARLGQDVLSRLVLPLGEFEKPEVRELAESYGLACANKPDSMEICFIPDNDYAKYIVDHGFKSKSGNFISPDGKNVGAHSGVLHYTVGQRKGLGIALGKPVFVREIKENGDIQLAFAGEEFFTTIQLRDMTTADGKPLTAGEYNVKIRSTATPCPCYFDGVDTVTFKEPIRAAAPGQNAAFYVDNMVLGCGYILKAF